MNHAAIFFKIANFDRRINDGNQKESSTEEEGRREEKEVTAASLRDAVDSINQKAPETGPFLFCTDVSLCVDVSVSRCAALQSFFSTAAGKNDPLPARSAT
jgi:hypothetical protein